MGGNHCDVTRPSHLDLGLLGRSGHWLGAPSLLPGSESRFLQGLNFNGLSSTASFQNFMNSTNPFSSGMMSREYRHRPELDFPPIPYPPSLVDQLPFNPFLHLPGTSPISGLAGLSKPHLPNRNIHGNGVKADESTLHDKTVSHNDLRYKTFYRCRILLKFHIS